jgi:excisionase family DNA binding protein
MDTTESLIASQDRLITAREAATLLRVGMESLRRWDKTGKLRAARTPGGYRRYRLSEIRRIQQGGLPEFNHCLAGLGSADPPVA